jgi:TRAP transporter TAXI family solute receptor
MGGLSVKKTIVLSLAILVGILAILFYWIPAPPKKIVIATGSSSGLYYDLGQRFKKKLEAEGVVLEVRQTAGSLENLKLLNDPKSDVSLAFIQGGIGNEKDYPDLNSIAGMYYEPLWVVYRAESFPENRGSLDSFSELNGKRVSIGNPGSGTLILTQEVFKLNEIDTTQKNFEQLSTDNALKKLGDKELDALMLVAAAEAPIMQKIFKDRRFKLMNLKHPKAYPPRMPYLKDLVIERGVLNIVNDVPSQSTTVLAPTAELVAKKSLHPALVSLMLEISYELLDKKSLLQVQKEFPSALNLSFQLNEDAEIYMKKGPDFLHRHLPFWAAVWVDRLMKLLIPLIAILFPLFNIIPNLLEYRTRLRFAIIYLELRKIEKDSITHQHLDTIRQRFDAIEEKAKNMKVPKLNEKDLYDLRAHVADIKRLLFS